MAAGVLAVAHSMALGVPENLLDYLLKRSDVAT